MPSTRDIRRRIKSVKNTAQITKAMQMVASSKMRRAQQAALAGRPYQRLLNTMLLCLRERVDHKAHPLLTERSGPRQLVLLLSTDKGLCGPLNTNLFREAIALPAADTEFAIIGRKGVQFLSRLRRKILADFTLPDQPTFQQAKAISSFLIEKFLNGEADTVSVLYPRFVSTLVQTPAKTQLLPISPEEAAGDPSLLQAEHQHSLTTEYLFEPSPQHVLASLLPYYVHFEVHQLILEARASEHSARMVAMKNATDNAKQLVKDLTLEYNKARQASITKEILEIATAQLAME